MLFCNFAYTGKHVVGCNKFGHSHMNMSNSEFYFCGDEIYSILKKKGGKCNLNDLIMIIKSPNKRDVYNTKLFNIFTK